jgi:hypothetical protein
MSENTPDKETATVENQITDAVTTPVKPAKFTPPNIEGKKQPLPETAFIEDTQGSNTKIYVDPNAVSAVVSGRDYDEVIFNRCVYKNRRHKKSLTVHHLQRRLVELGYGTAGGDIDGYYAEETQTAIDEFRADHKIKTDGPIDTATFEAIFKGDINVKVII